MILSQFWPNESTLEGSITWTAFRSVMHWNAIYVGSTLGFRTERLSFTLSCVSFSRVIKVVGCEMWSRLSPVPQSSERMMLNESLYENPTPIPPSFSLFEVHSIWLAATSFMSSSASSEYILIIVLIHLSSPSVILFLISQFWHDKNLYLLPKLCKISKIK